MIEEIWKDVAGYEGKYQVSNFGNVRSINRTITNISVLGNTKKCKLSGKNLKPRTSKSPGLKTGYYRVSLCGKNYCIHKLVAEAFIPNTKNKPQVDHIDCDVSNNCVKNLRWVTQKENNNNYETRKKMAILYNGEIARDIAKKNGISPGAFRVRLCKGWSLKDAITKPMKNKINPSCK